MVWKTEKFEFEEYFVREEHHNIIDDRGKSIAIGVDDIVQARLIAAAPEMLKALRSVVAEHEGDDEESFMPLPTMELVRAAIAKAEGRS